MYEEIGIIISLREKLNRYFFDIIVEGYISSFPYIGSNSNLLQSFIKQCKYKMGG